MMEKIYKSTFVVLYSLLVIFQIKTTNIKEAYTFTPAEIDKQIQRMNYYPPQLARLGYILESKKEVQLLKKLEENFFEVIDPGTYFPNHLPYILSPLFFTGLYLFAANRQKVKVLFIGFLFSVFVLTITGLHAKYGPVLILPFIYFITAFPIIKLYKKT